MASDYHESDAYLQRHELDLLEPSRDVIASPASAEEVGALVSLAQVLIPTLAAGEAVVRRISGRNPESVFAFRRGERLLGGIAYLFLNDHGLRALLQNEVNFSCPDLGILTARGEAPAAIYVWACMGKGRAMGGLCGASARLREFPYGGADYYAMPHTADGGRFLRQLGFAPVPALQSDLWRYRRRGTRMVQEQLDRKSEQHGLESVAA